MTLEVDLVTCSSELFWHLSCTLTLVAEHLITVLLSRQTLLRMRGVDIPWSKVFQKRKYHACAGLGAAAAIALRTKGPRFMDFFANFFEWGPVFLTLIAFRVG